MDPTSRMTALLAAMRRERNGAVAGAMRSYGTPCGLNYGVSLPTVRQIARREGTDHDFARYLWRQQVRELRLAALHIASPARFTAEEAEFWAAGIVDSELAEEAAFALLGRTAIFPRLFGCWVAGDRPLLRYAALMAAGRCAAIPAAWIDAAVEAVRRAAAEAAAAGPADDRTDCRIDPPRAAHLTALGAVALLSAAGLRDEEARQAVLRAAGRLGDLPAELLVREELAWRL